MNKLNYEIVTKSLLAQIQDLSFQLAQADSALFDKDQEIIKLKEDKSDGKKN